MTRYPLLLVAALLFPLLSGYLASYFYPGGFAMAQQQADGASGNAWAIVLLALVMVAGIFSSFVFERAKDSRQEGVPVSLRLSEITADFKFIAALFVSPLIFNSVYALTEQNPETLGDYLLAYQNGFFWQTVLAGVAGNTAGASARQPRRGSAPKRGKP